MLNYLWDNRGGVAIAMVVVFALGLFLNWVAWIFRLGRFDRTSTSATSLPAQSLRFVIANFFAEIINDFRHFLALVIVVLFAVALFASMYPGLVARDIGAINDGVQAVAAALGGLIGSIIGYYFGESAASRKPTEAPVSVRDTSSPVQQPLQENETVPGIVPAPEPPGGNSQSQ